MYFAKLCLLSILVFYSMTSAVAGLSPDQVSRLGKDLTPLGAVKAGNAAGTIPPWTGGITKPPAGYEPGMHHPDPFAEDKVLFTITAKNIDRHRQYLTPGLQALLATYPTYYINVYPTRRSASFPQRIYNMTKQIASTARLTDEGNGVVGAVNGIPFPIPENGLQAIWNHILRFRGDSVKRFPAHAAPTRKGIYTLVKFDEELYAQYSHKGISEKDLNNIILYFKQKVLSPARLAGSILVVHETLDQSLQNRMVWTYNPGQRRVRRAPNIAFDTPGTASDGMRTADQLDMFNGSPEKYDWTLVGRKEMYVPYNSYKLHSPTLKYKDILMPLHINPKYQRYELHRVWVVEANLKPGERHIYKRRTFYIDEDSWQILLVDQYDNRDQLWRVSAGHSINYYEVPTLWSTLEVHTDLQAGRYIAIGLDNESIMYQFNIKRSPENYGPAALRMEGKR